MYFIYFLKSLLNGKIYVGVTSKRPIDRLTEHNLGSNQWTRLNGPFKLIYFESYSCIEDAVNREKFYKSGFGRRIRDAIISTLIVE